MNTCATCNKKIIRNDYFAEHLKSHAIVTPTPVEPKEATTPIPAPQPVPPPPPPLPVNPEIVLNFSKNVEVCINGKHYDGKRVTAPNMKIAAEIVRLAREGYGIGILTGV